MTLLDCERFSAVDQLQTMWLRIVPDEAPIPEDVALPVRWINAGVEMQTLLAWIEWEAQR